MQDQMWGRPGGGAPLSKNHHKAKLDEILYSPRNQVSNTLSIYSRAGKLLCIWFVFESQAARSSNDEMVRTRSEPSAYKDYQKADQVHTLVFFLSARWTLLTSTNSVVGLWFISVCPFFMLNNQCTKVLSISF